MLLSGTYGHKHGCMSDKQPLRFTDKETTGEGSCKSKPSGNEHGNHCQSSSERRNKDYIVTEIPPPTTLPDIRKVSSKEFNKVVIDLETSSRGDDAEICQIAATDRFDVFNVYVVPQRGISGEASAVNKLSVKRGVLFHCGHPVTAFSQNEAVTMLLKWLKLKTPCVLIAHNAKPFDAKHLVKAIASCHEMKEFDQKVLGFSDTLTAFRERFPERRSFSQTNLAKDLLRTTYNAHNAVDDVKILQKLVSKFISDELLLKHSFTISWFREYTSFLKQKKENLKTFSPFIQSGVVSRGIAGKMAASGLNLYHLHFAFENGGTDGLYNVLTENVEDKPRVTNNNKILKQICKFFQEQMRQFQE